MKRIQLNRISLMMLSLLLLGIGMRVQGQTASPITGHWEGVVTREGKDWKICFDIESVGDGFKGTMDAPDYGLYALPLTEIKFIDSKIHLDHTDRSGKVTLDGNLEGQGITGQWEGIGVTAPFRLTRTKAQSITFVAEEIRFRNGDATLVGTLVKPNRAGRFPAVVFTHGSGNQTRTEDFYRSRAYLFASHGIAALIYDRRGKGASTGADITFINLAEEVTAMLFYGRFQALKLPES